MTKNARCSIVTSSLVLAVFGCTSNNNPKYEDELFDCDDVDFSGFAFYDGNGLEFQYENDDDIMCGRNKVSNSKDDGPISCDDISTHIAQNYDGQSIVSENYIDDYDTYFTGTSDFSTITDLIDIGVPSLVASENSPSYGNHSMAVNGYIELQKTSSWWVFTSTDTKWLISVDDGIKRVALMRIESMAAFTIRTKEAAKDLYTQVRKALIFRAAESAMAKGRRKT